MKDVRFMRIALSAAVSAAAICAATGAPQVSDVRTDGTDGNIVTVSYRLSGAPAVVTFSVETNAGDGVWMKVPDSATTRSWGDVARLVQPDAGADKTFWWRPDACWQGIKIDDASARLRVTA